jgi:hypothetical protein
MIGLITMVPCSGKKVTTLKPTGFDQSKTITIEKGDLKAIFIDNTGTPPVHRPGYNGITELYHSHQDSTVFKPSIAGFNLEHIFSGDSLIQFFEPRLNPMTLCRKSEYEVLLYQEATPVSGVESLTEFRLVEPCYIDVTFRCILHNTQYFSHGYAGFFWASYINNTEDSNIYFKGITEGSTSKKWITAFSEVHGTKSTHKGINDNYDLYFAPGFEAKLPKNYSEYRFSEPYYYGRFHNMVLAYLFKSSETIRLAQSPTGGGGNGYPAWDFQYIVPNPKIGKVYSFRARMIYKPFVGNKDISEEYEKYIKKNRRQKIQMFSRNKKVS